MNKTELIYCTNKAKRFFETLSSERNGVHRNYYDSRTKLIDGIYHIYPVAIDETQVYVCCPLCKQFHVHGYANGDYEGYLISHCKDKETEPYYVEKLKAILIQQKGAK